MSDARRSQLHALEQALQHLCALLALDANCTWRDHFQRCHKTSARLLDEGFTQADLNALSRNVRQVFGGMGSFNDYVPVSCTAAWCRLHGDPSTIMTATYDSALQLMVIDEPTD